MIKNKLMATVFHENNFVTAKLNYLSKSAKYPTLFSTGHLVAANEPLLAILSIVSMEATECALKITSCL